MSHQVELFAPLAGLITKARAHLTAESSVKDVTTAVKQSGLLDFVSDRIFEYTGMKNATLVITKSMTPDASTAMLYFMAAQKKVGEVKHRNAIGLIRTYGKAQGTMSSPLVRDLFNVARKKQTSTVSELPDLGWFQIYIRMSKGLFLPDQTGQFRYSDREVAGIICHEIGHTVWNVMSSDTIQNVDLAFHQVVETVRRHPPVSELKSILDILYKNKAYPDAFKKTIETLRSTSVEDGDPDYQNFCEVAVWLIMASSADQKQKTIDLFFRKAEDRQTGANGKTAMERFCDTYAGQCGYGADLASILLKMADYYTSPTAYEKRFSLNKMDAVLSAVLNPKEELASGNYDSLYDRLKDSIAASKQALTQDDLPPDLKAAIVRSIQESEQKYAEYKSQPYVKARNMFFRMTSALAQLKTLSLSGLASALEHTYSEFHHAVSIYNSGELSYMASLLEG